MMDKIWQKLAAAAIMGLMSILLSYAMVGTRAMSREDVETLIEKREASHEAKMDIVMSRLNQIEVAQARLEEKLDALREEFERVHGARR